jgi:probable phosphoglycerate mutase
MIILVRHGEATHHTEHLTGGWTNSHLTAAGKEQLQRVGGKLAGDFADFHGEMRILSSDLERAAESAKIIAAALPAAAMHSVEMCKFLREKNNGQAAGLTENEAKKLYCPASSPKEINHRNYPGGETRREFYLRNIQGLKKVADWEKENLLIVAHKGTIQNLIFAWLGLDMEQVRDLGISVDIRPAALTVLGTNKWGEHALFLLNALPEPEHEPYGIFTFKYGKVDGVKAE